MGRVFMFVLAGLAGCTAGKGHPCQEPNDCSGDLICCKASASIAARGTCEEECSLTPEEDSGAGDASTDTDEDAAEDAIDAADATADGA